MTARQTTARRTAFDPQLLAERIRAECLRRGWNVTELARRSGVNRGTLYRLERGETERPQIKTVQALAAAFGVSVEAFVDPAAPAGAGSASAGESPEFRFDRATNPVVTEVMREHPQLFEDWTDEDARELYSIFGTGGQLNRRGVLSAAESINRKRETIRKLHVVLETALREPAIDLIDMLYRLVQVPIGGIAATSGDDKRDKNERD